MSRVFGNRATYRLSFCLLHAARLQFHWSALKNRATSTTTTAIASVLVVVLPLGYTNFCANQQNCKEKSQNWRLKLKKCIYCSLYAWVNVCVHNYVCKWIWDIYLITFVYSTHNVELLWSSLTLASLPYFDFGQIIR